MQKAINKTKIKARRIPQVTGKSSIKRVANRTSAPRHRKLLTGKSASTFKPANAFALKPITKKLPFLTVASLQGEYSKYSDESVQIKMIADLYPVLCEVKGIENISMESTPAEVLTAMMQKFENSGDYERWSICEVGGKFKIKALTQYSGCESIHIAVDFLSQINRTHKSLHDLLIYGLRLVQNINGIPVFHDWCQSGNYPGQIYEYLLERKEEHESDEEYLKIAETFQYYGLKGIPTLYSKLLRGAGSIKLFKKAVESLVPKNDFEKYALPFLQSIIELVETKKKIYDYCEEPWEAGEAKPNDYMQVIWSWDDDDLMYQQFNECIDAMAMGCGVVGFCWESFIGVDEVKRNKSDYEFCDKVIDFFTKGNEMSHKIKNELKGVLQQPPLPLKEKKNGKRLIDRI